MLTYSYIYTVRPLPSLPVHCSDYSPVNATITIPIGAQTGSSYLIAVTITDDSTLETTEQFFLDLVTITPNSLTVEPKRAVKTVTILDNERKTSALAD